MNPPGWPPGYGPNQTNNYPPQPSTTSEWGAPINTTPFIANTFNPNTPIGAYPPTHVYQEASFNSNANTPTFQPAGFTPSPYQPTPPIQNQMNPPQSYGQSNPVFNPFSASQPAPQQMSQPRESSTVGIISPIPNHPVQPAEEIERPSSAPILADSSTPMVPKRDPKAIFSSTRKPLEVTSTPKSFILRLRDSPSKVLSIERKNSHPGSFIEHETMPQVTSKIAVYNAYGLLGIVVLTSETGEPESYLMLITGVEVVGTIQEIPIYRITQTTLVTFHPRNEYFYSQMPKPPSSTMKAFTESGLFYFSLDYHLTHTQQRLAYMERREIETQPLFKLADRRFFWNRFLSRAFIHKRLDDFVTVVIRGNVAIAEGQYLPESRQRCELAVISRLSCMRAGTRYNARGVNDNGDVGNFVETEQILVTEKRLASFVQIRGSVPVFWEEPLLKSGHTPTLSRTPEASAPAFKRHFDELMSLYEKVHIVNLLAKKKKELVIAEAYEDQLTRWKGLDSAKLRYTHFDFHAECAKGYDNISKLVNSRVVADDLFQNFAYFSLDLNDSTPSNLPHSAATASHKILSNQQGVFRTNCLDCLDRTNVTQTALARSILSKQIREIDGSQGIVSDQTRLGVMLNEMWADNGDALSKAYTGTGAMKSSYTRKGKHTLAGMLDDGLKSVTRFYINTFKDSDNQVAVDLFLGKIEELVDEEQPAEDLWVKEKLKDRVGEFTTMNAHNIFVGTYNCGAKAPPFSDGKFNLDEMLDPVKTSYDDVDIWVFGFQEIVELNAQQTLWSTDTSNPAAWEAAIANRLNTLRKSSKVVLLRSSQLVGIHVTVFVAEPHLPHFRDLNVETVKVGWKGVAGNKGAACLSFSFFDSTFCFVCAHLAAGHKEYDVRVSDYRTITNDLKFGLTKNYGKSINDHDYAFWLGDFNWRIDLTYYEVVQKVFEQNWDYLLRFDQMKRAQREGAAFAGFEEAPIKWAPTYKYDAGSDQYDTSELKRIPAWTDRIVYRAQEAQTINPLIYTRCELIWSDHRPVKGLFRLAVKTIDKTKAKAIKDEYYKIAKSMTKEEIEAQVRAFKEKKGNNTRPISSQISLAQAPSSSTSTSSSSPAVSASNSPQVQTRSANLIDVDDLSCNVSNTTISSPQAPQQAPAQPTPGTTVQQLPNGPLTPHYVKVVTLCCDYLKCFNNVQLIMQTSNSLATAIKTILDYVDSRPDVPSSPVFKQQLTAAVQQLAVRARAAVAEPTNQPLLHELAVQAKVVTEIIRAQLGKYM